MHILSILLFTISSSSDAIVVGLSYGAKGVKIDLLKNFIISIIAGIGTYLAMLFGGIIIRFIPCAYANIIGSSILVLFGVYLLVNSLRESSGDTICQPPVVKNATEFQRYENMLKNPEVIDTNNTKTIESREAFILGVILCLNNIGLGIGARITGLNIYITSLASLFCSCIFIPLGHYIGRTILSDKLSGYSEIASACIILVLGIYELFI